jgi:hypothetical protein
MGVEPIRALTCPECGVDVTTEVSQACRAQEMGVRETFSTEVFERVADAWATCANGHPYKYVCGQQAEVAPA